MQNEIKPALAPEEWARLETLTPDHVRIAIADGSIEIGSGASWETTQLINEGHGAAQLTALANTMNPNGITHADVDLLRDEAGCTPGEAEYQNEIALHNLADRIAALLPPRV